MTHKACFEEKLSETLIGVRVGNDFKCDLFLDFKESLTSLKYENLL